VPAEAHRLQRRVGLRDRVFFAALACAAAIGAGVGAIASTHGSRAHAAQGCVTRDAAGITGGGTWRYCGALAVAFCRVHAAEQRSLAAKCARLRKEA